MRTDLSHNGGMKQPSRIPAQRIRPDPLSKLLVNVRDCQACREHLPLGAKPVLQAGEGARILIAGQAPGRRAHESGIPFSDVSGDRLRAWLGVDHDTFYNANKIALLPMGFCYPGSGKSGDLPPRPECAALWRDWLLAQLPNIELTLLIGQYAQTWHIGDQRKPTLAQTVADWQSYWPTVLPMPHPSPRNVRWLKLNPWFEQNVIPKLRLRVAEVLSGTTNQ